MVAFGGGSSKSSKKWSEITPTCRFFCMEDRDPIGSNGILMRCFKGLADWCQTDKPFRRWKSVFPPLVITGAWRSIPIIKWFVTREGNICFDPEEHANCFGWCFGARGVFFCIPGSHPRKWKGLALLGHPDSNPKPAISGIVRCIRTMVPLWEILILSYISPYL